MEEVLHYLDLKNQYYEKFLRITEKFLEGASRKQWNHVAAFTDTRERILSIIHHYDYQIAQTFNSLDINPEQVAFYRPRVKLLLDKRTELVHRIVAIDLEIIGLIDEMKSESLKELKKSLKSSEEMAADAGIPAKSRALSS